MKFTQPKESFSNPEFSVIPHIHEIHVSIPVEFFHEAKLVCELSGIKVISLCRDLGGVPFDAMTSTVVMGTTREAMRRMGEISQILTSAGIPVIREKIEVPWSTDVLPEKYYLEAHSEVTLTSNQEAKFQTLQTISDELNFKVSVNSDKISKNLMTVMVTTRSSDKKLREFTRENNSLIHMLAMGYSFWVSTIMVELAIHDTNPMMDERW